MVMAMFLLLLSQLVVHLVKLVVSSLAQLSKTLLDFASDLRRLEEGHTADLGGLLDARQPQFADLFDGLAPDLGDLVANLVQLGIALGLQIRQLLGQLFLDARLIILDDGSRDW